MPEMPQFNCIETPDTMLKCACILVLVGMLNVCSQAAVLRGIVKLNELEGSAMPNVSITAEGAQPAVTESDGRFDLEFPNKHPGDLVEIGLAKEGYVVVHSVMLQQVLLADPNAPRVKILMAKEGDREEMARRFFRLKGDEAAEKNYHQQRDQLDARHQADAAALAQLQQELQQAKAAAAKAAEELARDRPGENSQMYQQAMRLFLDGKLDQALEVLDDAKLEQRKSDARRKVRELASDYQLKGRLLALKFRFAEATKAYESAVEMAPDDFEAHFALGYFAQSLNHQKQALASYMRCLDLARNMNNQVEVAMTLNNLGSLHRAEKRMAEARKAYEEALRMYRKLAAHNPATYMPDVAGMLNNLGVLHSDENRNAEARKAYEEALQTYRELAAHNPDTYVSYMATTLNNLGLLDADENRKAEARKAYEEALQTYRELAAHNPDTYLPDMAGTLNNLGNLHSYESRMGEARKAFEEALQKYRGLAAHNPDSYLPEVAGTLNNLGLLDADENRMAEARKAYEEALKIYQQFAEKSPGQYGPDVERVQRLLNGLKH